MYYTYFIVFSRPLFKDPETCPVLFKLLKFTLNSFLKILYKSISQCQSMCPNFCEKHVSFSFFYETHRILLNPVFFISIIVT